MILSVNKPVGLTSHDVVARLRKITGEKKIGHGGTLDPFASGVLVIGIGRESTRKLDSLLKDTDKEYEATLELGKTSTTDDPEGEIKEENPDMIPESEDELHKTLRRFEGDIRQTPPAHSAVKVGGKRAYKLARSGVSLKMPPREVTIKKIELIDFDPPLARVRVIASSGTYIRSLARDIGKRLSSGAYLKELVRTRVGEFSLDRAKNLADLETDSDIRKI